MKEGLEAAQPEGWGAGDPDINDPKYSVYQGNNVVDDEKFAEELAEEKFSRALSSEEVVQTVKDVVDVDADGVITSQEMRDASLRMRGIEAQVHANSEFGEADKDGNGFLSLDELMIFYELGEFDKKGNPKELTNEEKKTRDLVANMYSMLLKHEQGFTPQDLSKVFVPQLYPDALEAISVNEFKARDTDGDGQLSEEEFFASEVLESDLEEQKQGIVREFKVMDTDKSGSISLEEFRNFIAQDKSLDEGIAELLSEVDLDGDGSLTFDEITQGVQLMGSHPIVQDWYMTTHPMPQGEQETKGDGMEEFLGEEERQLIDKLTGDEEEEL